VRGRSLGELRNNKHICTWDYCVWRWILEYKVGEGCLHRLGLEVVGSHDGWFVTVGYIREGCSPGLAMLGQGVPRAGYIWESGWDGS